MPYHVGFLYMSDGYGNPTEIINDARAVANLGGSCSLFGNIYSGSRLDGLRYHPCSMTSTGSVTEWAALDTAITAAPWYDGSTASTEAFGFIIDEWSGLDGGVHKRAVYPSTMRRLGATFGMQRHSERVMSLNVLLVGSSERGLNHLFRWLETTLVASCSPCETNTLWMRETYPTSTSVAGLEESLAYLNEVVLIDGPTWVGEMQREAAVNLRMVNFTLTAGDPCFRRLPTVTSTTTGHPTSEVGGVGIATCSQFATASGSLAATLAQPGYGVMSPIVTISTGTSTGATVLGDSGYYAPAFRIVGFADDGSGVINPCGQPKVGFIAIDGLPPGSDIVVDCHSMSAQWRNLYTGQPWADGSQFLMPDVSNYGGVLRRQVSTAGCGTVHVLVEPARSNVGSYLGSVASLVGDWTVTIKSVARFGCG